MKYIYLITLLLPMQMFAQNGFKVEQRTITKSWIVEPAKFNDDFEVTINHLEAPFPSGSGEKAFLEKQKAKSAEMFPRNAAARGGNGSRSTGDSLSIVDSFAVNFFLNGNKMIGGTPNDNAMAISNDGKLIASWNSQLWGYDLEQDTFLFKSNNPHPSFGAFLAGYMDGDVGMQSSSFDPKLYYDPVRDRFVFLFLTVNRATNPYTNSSTIMAFSSSNNPSDPWYAYAIDGHPFDDGTWADYPQIALNSHSLYFTINQLSGNDWVADFEYTVIWQMDLDAAFSGAAELPARVIANDAHDNLDRRYMRPVKRAGGPWGDDIYLISNRTRSIQSDSFWLWHLEGRIDDGFVPTSTLLISDVDYGLPPYAKQANNHSFWTNDARPLGAVQIGSEIQFVGNSINHENGLAGIYHGIIENVNEPTLQGHIISDDVLEFGFANIEAMGKFGKTKEVIINFNHTSPVHPAGNAAVYFNDDREYGPIQLLVEGSTYVDMISQSFDINERWGDYIGLQRKFNEQSRAWAAGYFSHGNNNAGTWITELATPLDNYVGIEEDEKTTRTLVFPNPASQEVSVVFDVSNSKQISAAIYSMDGKLVKDFGTITVGVGKNELKCNVISLPTGVYFLKISDENGVFSTEKIVRN